MENLNTLTVAEFCKVAGTGFCLGFFMGFLTYLLRKARDVTQAFFTSYRG